MDHKDSIVILGAGLAGLSAAYYGGDIIFEKEAYVGGMCYSPKVKGYTFDHGIHVLHTKDQRVLKLLKNELGIKLPTQTRSAWIYSHGSYTRYPMQANTYGLPIPLVKECLVDFISVYNRQKYRFNHYEDWILSTFGEGFGRNFLIPYSEKFWTVSAKEMTTDWLDVRIPKPSLEDVIEGALTDQKKGFGPNARFRYPAGNEGISSLPERFKISLSDKGIPVRLKKEVRKIDTKNKIITFRDGTHSGYLKLISTLPLPELIKILTPRPPKRIIEAVKGLKYNSIICVNLGVNKKNLNPHHWIYYPEKEYCFFRISFLKNFSKKLVPQNMSSITAEISYSGRNGVNKNSIEKKTVQDLIKAKIISSSDQIVLSDIRDIKYAYVIYDHKRKKNVKIIKDYLLKNDILTAGRYGSWEYQWMDNAITDGKRAILKAKNNK